MIPKTIVKIPKNIFFTPKIPILMKFLVLVVTKTRHPEQTLTQKYALVLCGPIFRVKKIFLGIFTMVLGITGPPPLTY